MNETALAKFSKFCWIISALVYKASASTCGEIENRRQRDDESIDKFLDDLELLRKRSNLDERILERNLAIASKFMD